MGASPMLQIGSLCGTGHQPHPTDTGHQPHPRLLITRASTQVGLHSHCDLCYSLQCGSHLPHPSPNLGAPSGWTPKLTRANICNPTRRAALFHYTLWGRSSRSQHKAIPAIFHKAVFGQSLGKPSNISQTKKQETICSV